MASRPAVSTAPDALYLTGVLLLLVRALDQRFRSMTGPAAMTLSELGVLGQISRGVDAPSRIARALRSTRPASRTWSTVWWHRNTSCARTIRTTAAAAASGSPVSASSG